MDWHVATWKGSEGREDDKTLQNCARDREKANKEKLFTISLSFTSCLLMFA